SDISGEIVITQEDLHTPVFYFSKDQGSTWDIVNHGIGFPYLLTFTVGINENLYSQNDLNSKQIFYKKNSWSPWEISSLQDSKRFDDLMSFSDGTNTSMSDWGQLFETKNYGTDWEVMSSVEFGISHRKIIEKSEILFQIKNDKMHYSEDFGKNWNTFSHTDTSILFLFDPIVLPTISFGTYY